jgi:hypothetical protein
MEAGQVVAMRQGDQLAAWAIIALPDGFTHVQVSCIEGEAGALEELACALRGYAARLGKEGVEISACEDARLLSALEKAGYRSPEQFSVHVFEKRLS